MNFSDYSGQSFWGSVGKWVSHHKLIVAAAVVVGIVIVAIACNALCAAIGAAAAEAMAAISSAATAIANSRIVQTVVRAVSGAEQEGGGGAAAQKATSVANGASKAMEAANNLQRMGEETKAVLNPLENANYTPKVISQMENSDDLYHAFPRLIDRYGAYGNMETIIGGDGQLYTRLRIDGFINGQPGSFEYIIDQTNIINHRLFVPGE